MEVKCHELVNAIRQEAVKKGVSVSDMTIEPGGEMGEMPKKGKGYPLKR